MSSPLVASAPAVDAHGFSTPGAVASVEVTDPGVAVITFETGARLRLDALADDVVRLRLALPEADVREWMSYALDPEASWDGPSIWARHDGPEAVTLRTGALAVRIETASGALTVADADGCVLVDRAAASWTDQHVALTHRLGADDRLFGLGDKEQALDRRGREYEMWNTDAFKYGRGSDPLYKSVPFVLQQGTERPVGLFYDNSFRSWLDLGAKDPEAARYVANGGHLDVYVLAAATPLGVTERFSALTGRHPMFPKWALGYHQCRYSYLNEGEIREVARAFRARQIPCDTLYFDIHYMDGYRVFTWDLDAFPDPPKLLTDLEAEGFRSVVIVDPGVKADDPDYAIYRDGQARDAYVRYPGSDGEPGEEAHGEVWPGRCAFPDYTRADVRDWWGDLHEGLLAAGVDGVWNDMNEPALFAVAHVEGSMEAETDVGTLPDEVRHAFEGRGGDHREAHNVYGMQMLRATYEGLKRLRPEARPFTITRASFAGAQRFGSSWTGDNTATWDHLKLAIQTCLSLGASGQGFTGSDVGGFVGTPTGELVARWTQVGALTPLFRNHSAVDTPRQEPWLFGPEVERVCREAIELRYRLLPVLYTAMREAAASGRPMLRALPLVHPEDETIRRTDPLGFYVGDALLAHPVVEAGQTEREAYLPAWEGGWYDLKTGARFEGRQTVWCETPLDHVPLYVRGGSVLPLAPVRQHTGEPVRRLTLHVYPAPGRHESRLYDDAGDGWDFEDGAFWDGTLTLDTTPEAVRLEVSVEGSYTPEWEGWDVVVHGLGAAPARVTASGRDLEVAWDGEAARFAVGVGDGFKVIP
ncbi:MAG: TIM-barrel domain-containing protein [Bacteroidota bacterium]